MPVITIQAHFSSICKPTQQSSGQVDDRFVAGMQSGGMFAAPQQSNGVTAHSNGMLPPGMPAFAPVGMQPSGMGMQHPGMRPGMQQMGMLPGGMQPQQLHQLQMAQQV